MFRCGVLVWYFGVVFRLCVLLWYFVAVFWCVVLVRCFVVLFCCLSLWVGVWNRLVKNVIVRFGCMTKANTAIHLVERDKTTTTTKTLAVVNDVSVNIC